MSILRVLHFADLHLGVEAGGRPNPSTGLNQRIHDVLDRLDEVCACVEADGVRLVLFAGDAFKHQHPTPTLQKLFAERVRRMARAGARVFLLVGNHDLPRMAALAHPFSIYDALEVEGVVVGDDARLYTLELSGYSEPRAVQVAALPHFSRYDMLARHGDDVTADAADEMIRQAVHERVRALAAAVDASLPAVFCGHCHVNQAEVSGAQDAFGLSDLELTLSSLASSDAFPYYALGHVHRRQVLAREPFVAYSGSLERVDYSEGQTVRVSRGRARASPPEDKGFYRFDLEPAPGGWRLSSEPEFRTVRARPFVTVRVDDLGTDDPTASAVAAIAAARETGATIDGAFLKLAVSMAAADRSRLSYAAVRECVPEAYDLRLAVEVRDDAARARDPRFAARMSEVEALDRYLEVRNDWAEDRDELSRLGRELIREAAG